MRFSRRSFLTLSGGVAVSAAMPRARAAADDTVRIGIIGMGTRGMQLINAFGKVPGVRIAAVADPDRERLAKAAERAKPHNAEQKVSAVTDFRRILDTDDIDAVVVTAPNHWHALATVWACEAGKDVYVEKPVAHRIWESRQMIKAAEKYGRLVQGGMQRSSDPHLKALFARLRGGEFGRILRGRAIIYGHRQGIGKRDTPLTIPSFFDYNLWAGPAETRDLYRNSLHYDWHWIWETGNGELGNNGPHHLDLLRAALGVEGLAPSVRSFGGRFGWDDAGESPNTQVIHYGYEPAPIIAEVRNLPAKAGAKDSSTFRGQEGGIVIECEHAYFIGMGEGEIREYGGKVIEKFQGDNGAGHQANFIEAVRAGDASMLSSPIQVAHVSCALTLQGNISHKLGAAAARLPVAEVSNADTREALERLSLHLAANKIDLSEKHVTVGPELRFDPLRERFKGDHAKAANRYLKRDSYRAPFVLHKVT